MEVNVLLPEPIPKLKSLQDKTTAAGPENACHTRRMTGKGIVGCMGAQCHLLPGATSVPNNCRVVEQAIGTDTCLDKGSCRAKLQQHRHGSYALPTWPYLKVTDSC